MVSHNILCVGGDNCFSCIFLCVRICVCQALQFLSKAHRCEVQVSGWEKDTGTFKEVIRRAIDLANGE